MNKMRLPKPELTDASYFDIDAARAALSDGHPVAFPPFEVVHLPQYGLSVCLNMRRDPIQGAIRRGDFYEINELEALKDHVKSGAHVIDIGSNIGNHTLFFAGVMQAARVVVIEPNPLAMAPLVGNIVINRLTGIVDLTHLGLGLSDMAADGFGMRRHDRNLGATKMREGQGDLRVVRGDDLFSNESPDLIKIDVEGMEMKVLSGLEQTIARTRPTILIEVDDANATAFADWMTGHRYQSIRTDRRSKSNGNHLVVPTERASA